jgi:hypothetical protein
MLTNISDVLTASIIRLVARMIWRQCTPLKCQSVCIRLRGTTSHKTAIFSFLLSISLIKLERDFRVSEQHRRLSSIQTLLVVCIMTMHVTACVEIGVQTIWYVSSILPFSRNILRNMTSNLSQSTKKNTFRSYFNLCSFT